MPDNRVSCGGLTNFEGKARGYRTEDAFILHDASQSFRDIQHLYDESVTMPINEDKNRADSPSNVQLVLLYISELEEKESKMVISELEALKASVDVEKLGSLWWD